LKEDFFDSKRGESFVYNIVSETDSLKVMLISIMIGGFLKIVLNYFLLSSLQKK